MLVESESLFNPAPLHQGKAHRISIAEKLILIASQNRFCLCLQFSIGVHFFDAGADLDPV